MKPWGGADRKTPGCPACEQRGGKHWTHSQECTTRIRDQVAESLWQPSEVVPYFCEREESLGEKNSLEDAPASRVPRDGEDSSPLPLQDSVGEERPEHESAPAPRAGESIPAILDRPSEEPEPKRAKIEDLLALAVEIVDQVTQGMGEAAKLTHDAEVESVIAEAQQEAGGPGETHKTGSTSPEAAREAELQGLKDLGVQ